MRHWGVALVTVAVAAVTGWAVYVAADPRRMPVSAVQMEGELKYLARPALAQVVAGPASLGFFRVDLGEVRAAILALPWAKEARVRRVWPDRLHMVIRERVPAARWAAGGLLDVDGDLFQPPPAEYPAGLPELDGPEGTHRQVLQRYGEFRGWLAPSGWRIERLSMDARRAWRVETDQGIALVLGRDPAEPAVRRVARVLPALRAQVGDTLTQVDLRYPNGFAVRRQAPPVTGPKPEAKPEGKERHGKEVR